MVRLVLTIILFGCLVCLVSGFKVHKTVYNSDGTSRSFLVNPRGRKYSGIESLPQHPKCGHARMRPDEIIFIKGNKTKPRISGGRTANDGEYPSYVYLKIDNNECGGVIIGRNHILTAAHCIYQGSYNPVEIYHGTIYPYWKYNGSNHRRYFAKAICRHPHFNAASENNDIAVIQVDDMYFDWLAQPACLIGYDHKLAMNDQKIFAVPGMGYTYVHQNIANSASRLQVLYFNWAPCKYESDINQPSKICFVSESRYADKYKMTGHVCEGDTGGPVLSWERNAHYVVALSLFSYVPCDAGIRDIGGFSDIYNQLGVIDTLIRSCS